MALRRIGAVLDALREEFPDVSISKIRFLEAEGLLTPQRAPSGYRLYADHDVERLSFVLRAQRDRFWPLKVIREALDGMDRGLSVDLGAPAGATPEPPAVTTDPDLPAAESLRDAVDARLTLAELARTSGASRELIDELVSYSMLRADKDGHFSGQSARIASAAADLGRFGIEARHLRVFRTAAEREVGLVDYAAAGASSPDAASVALACLGLHTALVKDELGRRG